jgi:hypothetical protein
MKKVNKPHILKSGSGLVPEKIRSIEDEIRHCSPIQRAITKQLICSIKQKPDGNGGMDTLLTKAIDDQKDWAIRFLKYLRYSEKMGTRSMEKALGIKRSVIRGILKST